DSELLLCHGMVCVVGRMRDLILQLSKSSIYSTKPRRCRPHQQGTEHRGKGHQTDKAIHQCFR
nr:hypothetical protein [Escherichia coli]